jgi:2-oxo-3-hexenedioate decarboxylase
MHQALNTADIDTLAARLDGAAREARAVAQLSADTALDLEAAYAVQAASIGRRLARGERQVGVKMGFTSRAKMQQMGVSDLIWGRLTDAMHLDAGAELPFARFIHPRAEPEIAFRLARPLAGNVSLAQAMAAVDAVAPAIEIIDSRYANFRFSLTDVVADNSSSSAFVTGTWVDPSLLGSNELDMALLVDGQVVESGTSAAILGNPWESLIEAARLASVDGSGLAAGWIVLAGAATAAHALAPGMRVSTRAGVLGETGFTVSGTRETRA